MSLFNEFNTARSQYAADPASIGNKFTCYTNGLVQRTEYDFTSPKAEATAEVAVSATANPFDYC